MTGELPEPLSPAECDLRDFPFMLFDIVRLRNSHFDTVLDDGAWKAGILLMAASWHLLPAASLPNNDTELAALAGLGGHLRTWRRIKCLAMRDWIKCSDGRWYHPAIAHGALIAWRAKLRFRAKFDRRLEMESGEWTRIRSEVFERDDFTCQYCGARGVKLECDHVLPRVSGGQSTHDNLVTACRQCNRSKGPRTPSEWLA